MYILYFHSPRNSHMWRSTHPTKTCFSCHTRGNASFARPPWECSVCPTAYFAGDGVESCLGKGTLRLRYSWLVCAVDFASQRLVDEDGRFLSSRNIPPPPHHDLVSPADPSLFSRDPQFHLSTPCAAHTILNAVTNRTETMTLNSRRGRRGQRKW